MQWYGTLLPRVHRFIPARTVVEIACGYGRWTEHLRGVAEHTIAVDLNENCVAACRERFAHDATVSCHVTDGRSLPMVPDGSADLVFSFDSLVHADRQVMDAYLAELTRILSPDGAAFLHHSNLGSTPLRNRLFGTGFAATLLKHLGLIERRLHWRDPTVSAAWVAAKAARYGLHCATQELFGWQTRRLIDCISVVVRDATSHETTVRVANRHFGDEMASWGRLAPLYGAR